MPQITKTKTTIYEVTNARSGMMKFDDTYINIRHKSKYKGFECYACNRHFVKGESIGVVFTTKGNKVVCNDCADKFAEELKGAE